MRKKKTWRFLLLEIGNIEVTKSSGTGKVRILVNESIHTFVNTHNMLVHQANNN